MAYIMVESSVRTHKKFLKVGPAAAWLWLCGIGYCQDGLTDGFIPADAIDFLGVKKPLPLAERLVEARLWDRVDDGWQVHDYLAHNKSSGQVRDTMRRRKEGGHLGGRPFKNQPEKPYAETLEVNHPENPIRPSDPSDLPELPTVTAETGEEARAEATNHGGTMRFQNPHDAGPSWRPARLRQGSPLDPGLDDYHRRNCAIWAAAACLGGLCVPVYLWPQWQKRKPVTELESFVALWIGRAAGDTAEKFWPRAFEQHFGTGLNDKPQSRGAQTVDGMNRALAKRQHRREVVSE